MKSLAITAWLLAALTCRAEIKVLEVTPGIPAAGSVCYRLRPGTCRHIGSVDRFGRSSPNLARRRAGKIWNG